MAMLLLQGTLGAWNSGLARVRRYSHAQRTTECLEYRFDNVVVIVTTNRIDVKRNAAVITHSLEELLEQVDIKAANGLFREVDIVFKAWAT